MRTAISAMLSNLKSLAVVRVIEDADNVVERMSAKQGVQL